MGKYDEYTDYMTEEDIEMARQENQSLWRFISGLLLCLPYGAIAFFDVWKMREALPLVLIRLFPGVEYGDPSQLYTYISILAGCLIWFITFALLWSILARPAVSIKKRLITLGMWCAAAAAVYIVLSFATILIVW